MGFISVVDLLSLVAWLRIRCWRWPERWGGWWKYCKFEGINIFFKILFAFPLIWHYPSHKLVRIISHSYKQRSFKAIHQPHDGGKTLQLSYSIVLALGLLVMLSSHFSHSNFHPDSLYRIEFGRNNLIILNSAFAVIINSPRQISKR